MLTTWHAGHLTGLDVRWVDPVADGEDLAEIYRRRSPHAGRWRLWKPAEDSVCLRHMPSGQVEQAASVAAALAIVADREAMQVPDCDEPE